MNLETIRGLGPLALSINLESIRSLALLAVGFGFVVFWHELGHFLAAKWAGVKVEQFAVGFGQALLAWRKGLGLRVGTTTPEFRKRLEAHLESQAGKDELEELRLREKTDDDEGAWTELQMARAARELGLSDTEYRLNWIPLGGYVKMLGQDDLKANAEAEDPRAYNRQTIGKRMVIVSAGVIMNVILAAIGFMVLFMIGFHVPPAKVGRVYPNSPAQVAGLQVGDVILTIDGKDVSNDWTKVQLNVALADTSAPIPIEIERTTNGKPERLKLEVTPQLGSGAMKNILSLGIEPAYELKYPSARNAKEAADEADAEMLKKSVMPDVLALKPGDTVTAIDGRPVDVADYAAFDAALQASAGCPVTLTVKTDAGATAERTVRPHFLDPHGEQPMNFAGMLPRVQVSAVTEHSPALGWVLPGDVIESVSTGKEQNTLENPSAREFRSRIKNVNGPIRLVVLRATGEEIIVNDLGTTQIDPYTRGLGVGLGYDEQHAVVADTLKDSAAAKAGIPAGAQLTAVGGRPVATWHDVRARMVEWLAQNPAAAPSVPVAFETSAGESKRAVLALSADEVKALQAARYRADVPFGQPRDVRKAANPWVAVKWGVTETRDFILQFYLTLRRMVTGGVPAEQAMGPIGIFQAGSSFASRGADWLIWFLSMISANLAVVNFLPIPIVDGGLFTFLILEKIKGKPLSPRTQAIAQYVGLALLVGVFLFVTYQDLTWFSYRGR